MAVEINLLGNKTTTGFQTKGVLKIFNILIFIVLVFAVGTFAFFKLREKTFAKESKYLISEMQKEQQSAIDNESRKEIVTRLGQVAEANKLIDEHNLWSNMIPELARVTIRSAQYSSLELNSDGSLTLVVNGSSYDELDLFLQAFNLPKYNSIFSEVKVLTLGKTVVDNNAYAQMKVQLKFDKDFIKLKQSNGIK